MKTTLHCLRTHCQGYPLGPKFLLAAGLVACALATSFPGVGSSGQTLSEKPAKSASTSEREPAAVEVRYVDDSTMKLTVVDERLEFVTPYGKLFIPLTAIVKIEFANRLPEDVAKRIEAAVADLGSLDFKRRSAATAELTKLGERAFPALVDAAKQADPEVVKRSEELLNKLRQTVAAERLEVRPHDIVTTADSRISGRIVATALKVKTFQFGDQQLKLADVRSLQPLGADRTDLLAEAMPDPGTLVGFQGQVGRTLVFKVTGQGAQQGGVWGTGVYTIDSSLALAAVHAGVVRVGQTGMVRVTPLGNVQGFTGSFQNGINSGNYPAYAGYKVSK
jgi:hypothetical protein